METDSGLRYVILIVRFVAGGDETDPRMNSWAAVETVLRTKEESFLLRSMVAAMPRNDTHRENRRGRRRNRPTNEFVGCRGDRPPDERGIVSSPQFGCGYAALWGNKIGSARSHFAEAAAFAAALQAIRDEAQRKNILKKDQRGSASDRRVIWTYGHMDAMDAMDTEEDRHGGLSHDKNYRHVAKLDSRTTSSEIQAI